MPLNTSSMLRVAAWSLLATSCCAFGVKRSQRSVQFHVDSEHETGTPWKYKKDCWQKRPASFAQVANVPGAGLDKFAPFETVEKDGFLEAACVKDYMYSYGDKFGDNRFSYKLEDSANVSIVHYAAHVPKEDRKSMKPTVCFEFCRTVPNMGFFGIVNGRDCYCTPYYKPMESDSSNCDAVCEGDPVLMCGGKSKSTVFSMHMCADTEKELTDAKEHAAAVASHMTEEVGKVKELSTAMQESANTLQTSFSTVGDSATTNLLQSAKVFAGDLLHAAEDAEKVATKLGDLETEAGTVTSFTESSDVTKAEGLVVDLEKTLAEGEQLVTKLHELEGLASPPSASVDASKQYYPVMYFADKEFVDAPQTCGGDVVAKPIVKGSLDECATACDKHTHECVGFGYFEGSSNLCFLFSKFKTAFYYTGCDGGAEKAFLQEKFAHKAAPYTVKCLAKFSKFDGTTLKPDPSGKCKLCLKKLTKADRCFA